MAILPDRRRKATLKTNIGCPRALWAVGDLVPGLSASPEPSRTLPELSEAFLIFPDLSISFGTTHEHYGHFPTGVFPNPPEPSRTFPDLPEASRSFPKLSEAFRNFPYHVVPFMSITVIPGFF